jgi:hypothetical protein
MTTNTTSVFSRSFRVLCIHFALLLFFFSLIYYFTFGNFTISISQFAQWDANWYSTIKDQGYTYIEGSQNSTGFFPGFPFFWKLSGVDILGMCVINFLLFLSSFLLLAHVFNPKERTQYLFLSIPCLFFFIVPYSESLFFLFTTLLLIGLKKNNWWLTMVSFALATFTRSAATIFIPALVASVFFIATKENWKKTLKEFLLYIFACITITFLVIYIQYLQTDVWFAAAKTHKHWEHELRMPKLPFHSWGATIIARLDGTAMFVGLTALVILLGLFISKLKNTYTEKEKSYLFSLLYLAGITFSMLLFQGGDMHSLNRYIFATPFYFIFLLEFEKRKFSYREVTITFLLLTLFWLLFGSYKHILTFIYCTLISLLFVLCMVIYTSSEKKSRWAFIIVYIVSTILQAYFFAHFLNGMWIG